MSSSLICHCGWRLIDVLCRKISVLHSPSLKCLIMVTFMIDIEPQIDRRFRKISRTSATDSKTFGSAVTTLWVTCHKFACLTLPLASQFDRKIQLKFSLCFQIHTENFVNWKIIMFDPLNRSVRGDWASKLRMKEIKKMKKWKKLLEIGWKWFGRVSRKLSQINNSQLT